MDERWGRGLTRWRVCGECDEETQKKSRNPAEEVVQCSKEVVPFHKRSRAMWENVARSRKKWRDSGKSWAFPNESPLVCAKSFRFFCHPWDGTRAGRDFNKAGCGDRTECWRSCEEDRLHRMKSGTMRGDTSRHCGKREGWGIA